MAFVKRILESLFQPERQRSHTFRPGFEMLEDRRTPTLTAPTNLQLTPVSPSQLRLDWADVDGEVGYRIIRWDGTQVLNVATVNANVTTYTASGLTPAQTQYFAVEALGTGTALASTAWMNVTMPADAITAPSWFQPRAISATQIELDWGAASGAQGYRLFVWDGSKALQIGNVGPDTTSVIDGNLSPAQFYYFYIEAFNATNSAVSPWQGVRTLPDAIDAPTGLTLTVRSATQIDLSWNDVAGEYGYRIFRWDGKSTVQIGTLGSNYVNFSATKLSPGHAYWFYVEAYNATNVGDTAWKQANTPALANLSPTTLTVKSASATSVVLNWSQTSSSGTNGFYIYQSQGTTWSKIKTVSTATHQATVTGLVKGQRYYFTVQAYSANGYYADGATVTIML